MDQQSEFVSGGTEGAPEEKDGRAGASKFGDKSKEKRSRIWDELAAGVENWARAKGAVVRGPWLSGLQVRCDDQQFWDPNLDRWLSVRTGDDNE